MIDNIKCFWKFDFKITSAKEESNRSIIYQRNKKQKSVDRFFRRPDGKLHNSFCWSRYSLFSTHIFVGEIFLFGNARDFNFF